MKWSGRGSSCCLLVLMSFTTSPMSGSLGSFRSLVVRLADVVGSGSNRQHLRAASKYLGCGLGALLAVCFCMLAFLLVCTSVLCISSHARRVCDFGFGVRVRDMQVGRGQIFVPCTSAFSDICGLVFGSGTLATTWRSLMMAADGKFEARCGVLLLLKHE